MVWEKAKNITITFVSFVLGVIVSVLGASLHLFAHSAFPMTIFGVACTLLMAAIALPQIAIGLSNSHIAKSLVPEFYKSARHWIFLFFQAVIALTSICVIHISSEGGYDSPTVLYRILLGLIVFDFFYGFYYLDSLNRFISSPHYMLTIYLKRIRRILKKKPAKGFDAFKAEIDNIECIGRSAIHYEKSEILNTIYEMLKMTLNKDVPNALKQTAKQTSDEQVGKSGPTGNASPNNVITKLQHDAWILLVKGISDICIIRDEVHAADKDNAMLALQILKKPWDIITVGEKGDRDFSIYPKALKEFALFAINKGYDDILSKAAEAIHKIAKDFIKVFAEGRESYPKLFVSPVDMASNIKEIGFAVVRADRYDLLPQFIAHLYEYFDLSQKEVSVYLFDVLNLMSFTWEANKDALEDLKSTLDDMESEHVQKALQYGRETFPREAIRVERFLFRKKVSHGSTV